MVYNQGGDQTEGDEDEAPEISKWESIIWLTILTLWISVLSEYLVNAIEVILKRFICNLLYTLLANQFLGMPVLLLGQGPTHPPNKKVHCFCFLCVLLYIERCISFNFFVKFTIMGGIQSLVLVFVHSFYSKLHLCRGHLLHGKCQLHLLVLSCSQLLGMQQSMQVQLYLL